MPRPIASFVVWPRPDDKPAIVADVTPLAPRRRLALAPISAADMAARRADAWQRVADRVRVRRVNTNTAARVATETT